MRFSLKKLIQKKSFIFMINAFTLNTYYEATQLESPIIKREKPLVFITGQ